MHVKLFLPFFPIRIPARGVIERNESLNLPRLLHHMLPYTGPFLFRTHENKTNTILIFIFMIS